MSTKKCDRAERARRDEQYTRLRDDFLVVMDRSLAGAEHDDFRAAVRRALEAPDTLPDHLNRLAALAVVGACVQCFTAGDHASTKLLLYVSGVILAAGASQQLLDDIEAARVFGTEAKQAATSVGLSVGLKPGLKFPVDKSMDPSKN